ncbi:MAG: TonB-system energizer ExbB [Holophaga sp.]|nr:TonB-system energizer ExbB [Holophaga sp.]
MEKLKLVVDYGIIGLLVAMSIAVLGIFLERRGYYRSIAVERFQGRKELELALTERLNLIAIIASNSPYIGLLGTVLGIMLTFAMMGRDNQMDSGRIMLGLSLALKSTAAGLFVAIPAVTMYNLLLRRVKVILMQWDIRHG